MRTVEFTRVFAAAHRLWNDEGKCSNIHGHNFTAEVTIDATEELTEQGFVVPFDSVKAHIDALDHSLIVDISDPLYPKLHSLGVRIYAVSFLPSTENLARHLAIQIAGVTGAKNPDVHGGVSVRLRETAGILAQGFADIDEIRDQGGAL